MVEIRGAKAPSRPLRATATATVMLAAMLAFGGCTTSNPDVVGRGEAQRLATVTDAVVLHARPVVVDGNQSGIGATAGGVVGGVAGSTVGGSRESVVVGVLGAVAGAVIGNAVERASTHESAVELLVQLRNGERRSIVQAKGEETFSPGDAVLLIAQGGRVKVARNPAAPTPTLQQTPSTGAREPVPSTR